MSEMPLPVVVLVAAGAFALGVFGLRGFLEIVSALHLAELDRLSPPHLWQVTRAGVGLAAAVPVFAATHSLGVVSVCASLVVMALGFWVAPRFLAAAKERVQREVERDLALHLDLMALSMEAGGSWASALAICTERAPDGALRRAWARVILDIHSGTEPLEALRALELRLGSRLFSSLVSALRAAERLRMEPVSVLRERARQSAAKRFARAEHLARVAPLKLWAALMLCIAPCTLVLLAFPVARMLALVVDR